MVKSPLKDLRGFSKRSRSEVLRRRRKKEKIRSQKQNRLKKNQLKNRKPRKRTIQRIVRTNPRPLMTGQTKHVIFSLSLEVIPDLKGGSWHWQRLRAFIIL
jgi:hypothetical protein